MMENSRLVSQNVYPLNTGTTHAYGCIAATLNGGAATIQQQQQTNLHYTITDLTIPPGYAQERNPMASIDTKKFKFALHEESRGFIGAYETVDEAKKTATKALADNKGGTYTIFQALLQIESKPLETVETPIP